MGLGNVHYRGGGRYFFALESDVVVGCHGFSFMVGWRGCGREERRVVGDATRREVDQWRGCGDAVMISARGSAGALFYLSYSIALQNIARFSLPPPRHKFLHKQTNKQT